MALLLVAILHGLAAASGLPVVGSHPRLLLTPAISSILTARKNANDPAWTALAARADTLATYAIFRYEYATHGSEPDNTIFYDYEAPDGLTR